MTNRLPDPLQRFVDAVEKGRVPLRADLRNIAAAFKAIADGADPNKALGVPPGRGRRPHRTVAAVAMVLAKEAELGGGRGARTRAIRYVASRSIDGVRISQRTLANYVAKHADSIRDLQQFASSTVPRALDELAKRFPPETSLAEVIRRTK